MKIADHIENAEPVYEGTSVYKAAKTNGTYSAVNIFPFVLTEDQLMFFNEQVEQLEEAYIEYRTAIPRVLSHGFTQTGSFPFIETEWIEGYHLDELMKQQGPLTIGTVINIAVEVSRAMAQCHKLGVLHGDINTSKIIWDSVGKRYVITGFQFGLKPAKNLIQQSKSVAVIAPVQKHELKTREQDVHDIGAVLWQLLTGERWQPGDDLNQLRMDRLPSEWNEDKKKQEQIIPTWFITCIHKAVGIVREKKFEDAVQLYGYILSHHKTPFQKKDWYRSKPQSFSIEPKAHQSKAGLFSKLIRHSWIQNIKSKKRHLRFVFDRNIAAGLIIAALLLGFSIYAQKRDGRREGEVGTTQKPGFAAAADSIDNGAQKPQGPVTIAGPEMTQKDTRSKTVQPKTKPADRTIVDSTPSPSQGATNNLGSYKVRSKAYFHNEPNETTKRNAFIVHWNNAVLHPLKEEGDFVYIVFTNHLGQTSKGWLRKQDLIRL